MTQEEKYKAQTGYEARIQKPLENIAVVRDVLQEKYKQGFNEGYAKALADIEEAKKVNKIVYSWKTH